MANFACFLLLSNSVKQTFVEAYYLAGTWLPEFLDTIKIKILKLN